MIRPLLQDDVLLADIKSAGATRGELHLWWLGQSGFLIQHDGRHLLVDPYLSDSLTAKYAATDKPHVRMTERVIAPERLDFVDVAASTHNHTDHFDPETLAPLLAVNPKLAIVVPAANRETAAERLGVSSDRLLGIDDGQAVDVGEFELTAVPAAHETIERDEQGRMRFLGYLIRAGGFTVYHAGDTVLYEGMVARLASQPIDVALLPINGREPARRVAGNLWGREAAWLAREIGARVAVPCHYEMFKFNTATPEEFVAECNRLGQPFRVVKAGERLTVERN
ncbi:MAG TPA: MBL fold metallo-hydrolase [Pirellulales bacterium]|nr:MBL fold metallo-hydrolase [Pirellulales bacterium]